MAKILHFQVKYFPRYGSMKFWSDPLDVVCLIVNISGSMQPRKVIFTLLESSLKGLYGYWHQKSYGIKIKKYQNKNKDFVPLTSKLASSPFFIFMKLPPYEANHVSYMLTKNQSGTSNSFRVMSITVRMDLVKHVLQQYAVLSKAY